MLTRFGMLPMKAVDASFGENPVGTGPYKFVQWIKGDRVILEANPNYFGGAPKISRLTYRTITDNSARLAALEAGEIEVGAMLPPEAASLPTSKFTIFEGPSVSYAQWMFNFRNKTSPIADVKVRKALQYAIDEPGLINGVLSGKAIAAKGPAPSVCFGAADVGGYPKRDVAKAKQLLAAAGYASGMNLVMMFSPELVRDVEVTEAIQQQLKEAGVTVKIDQLEQAAYMERRPTANWDIASSSVGAWTADADFYLSGTPGQNGYNNPAMTAALANAGNAVMDLNERARYLKEAEQIFWDDVSYLWSYQTVMFNVMTNRLKNAMVLPTGWIYYWKAELTG
jgi:ABC-type transport system substrate-binding protein